jgi:hypothetical protein
MFSDTHPDVERAQVTILSSMPSWRKFRLVNDLIVTGRKLALAGYASGFLEPVPKNFNVVLPLCFWARRSPKGSMARNPIPPPSVDPAEPLHVLQRVIASLEALGIHYMLVGSFASSLHGLARFTQDADLIVDLHPGQLDAFAQAFASDFYVDPELIQQALKRGTSFNIIHFESSFKVAFFLSAGGISVERSSRVAYYVRSIRVRSSKLMCRLRKMPCFQNSIGTAWAVEFRTPSGET